MDPAWDTLNADGRTWWQASEHMEPVLDENAVNQVEALLGDALDMRPGRLPPKQHQEYKNLLGLDDPTLAAPMTSITAPPTGPVRPPSTNPLLSRTLAQTPTLKNNSAPASPRNPHPHGPAGAVRPERAGKKRRYDESSYTGYHEGFEDDGYSTGGGLDERRGSAGGRNGSGSANKRQKRKVSGRQAGFYEAEIGLAGVKSEKRQ